MVKQSPIWVQDLFTETGSSWAKGLGGSSVTSHGSGDSAKDGGDAVELLATEGRRDSEAVTTVVEHGARLR